MPHTGSLKQQVSAVSQSRLESKTQVLAGLVRPEASLWGMQMAVSSPCAHVGVLCSQGLQPCWVWVYIDDIFKVPISRCSHILRSWGCILHYECW